MTRPQFVKECPLKNSCYVVGPLILVALICPGFTTANALSDERHNRPVPVAESVIQPALPSAGYILTRSRGRAMVSHGVVPCPPRCGNNLTSGTTTVLHSSPPAAGHDSSTAAPAIEDSELRALLEARRDVLKQAVEILNTSFRQGITSPNAVIAANVALLEAELELAKSKEERLLVLQQLLEHHKQLEQQTEKMFEATLGRREDCLAAKAARLKAEIALHKARKAE